MPRSEGLILVRMEYFPWLLIINLLHQNIFEFDIQRYSPNGAQPACSSANSYASRTPSEPECTYQGTQLDYSISRSFAGPKSGGGEQFAN